MVKINCNSFHKIGKVKGIIKKKSLEIFDEKLYSFHFNGNDNPD